MQASAPRADDADVEAVMTARLAKRLCELPISLGGDALVPDTLVREEFSISAMTLWKWSRDEKLGFPPVVKIKTRNYRSRRALDEFKARLLREAISGRAGTVNRPTSEA
jgi:hypothetical protein